MPLVFVLVSFSFFLSFFFFLAASAACGSSGEGVESELQVPAYTKSTATRDPSYMCNLCHSLRQHWIPQPTEWGQRLNPHLHEHFVRFNLLSNNRTSGLVLSHMAQEIGITGCGKHLFQGPTPRSHLILIYTLVEWISEEDPPFPCRKVQEGRDRTSTFIFPDQAPRLIHEQWPQRIRQCPEAITNHLHIPQN